MKNICLTFIVLITISINAHAQKHKKIDWKIDKLKGRVEKVSTDYYKAVDRVLLTFHLNTVYCEFKHYGVVGIHTVRL